MTEEGRIRVAGKGLDHKHGGLAAYVLNLLLKQPREEKMTFSKLEDLITRGGFGEEYDNYYDLNCKKPGVKKIRRVRAAIIHAGTQRMQEEAWERGGKIPPLHSLFTKLGITALPTKERAKLLKQARASTFLWLLLQHYHGAGFLELRHPREKYRDTVLEIWRGKYVIHPETEIRLKYKRALKKAIKNFVATQVKGEKP